MNKMIFDLNNFLKTHPLNFAEPHPIKYNAFSKDIPMYRWTLINSNRGIGMVHAYKLKHDIVVRSDRYYSNDARVLSYEEYDEWRKEIEQLHGQ